MPPKFCLVSLGQPRSVVLTIESGALSLTLGSADPVRIPLPDGASGRHAVARLRVGEDRRGAPPFGSILALEIVIDGLPPLVRLLPTTIEEIQPYGRGVLARFSHGATVHELLSDLLLHDSR